MNTNPFAMQAGHDCHDSCGCRNTRHTKQRMQIVHLDTMYSRRIDKPSLKEWTNVQRCSKQLAFGFCNNNTIAEVWKTSVGELGPEADRKRALSRRARGDVRASEYRKPAVKLSLGSLTKHRQEAAGANCGPALNEFLEETDWHRMTGKKATLVSKHLMTNEAGPAVSLAGWKTVLLAITLEGPETMSTWHFHAEQVGHLTADEPRLFDLLWPERSPATLVLQFLSTLLHDHPLVGVLCRLSGSASVHELFKVCEKKVHYMRTSWVYAHGWSYVRHVHRFRRFKVLIVADRRRSFHDRIQAAIEFKTQGCPRCHKRESFRKVHAAISEPDELFASEWQFRLFQFARLASLGNAECELTHSQNNRDTCKQTRWDQFCARAWCREQRNAATLHAQQQHVQSVEDQPQPPVAAQVAADDAPPLFNSIAMWWHWYCCKLNKQLGDRADPASGNHWAACSDSWKELSQEEQAAYVEMWQADTRAARSSRATRAAEAEARAADADDESSAVSPFTPLAGLVDNRIVGLAPQTYADFCRHAGETCKKHAATFQRFVYGFARDRGHVPKRVVVHATCEAVCCAAGDRRVRLFRALRDAVPRRLRACAGKEACRNLRVLVSFTPLADARSSYFLLFTDLFGRGVDGVDKPGELVLDIVPIDGTERAIAAQAEAQADGVRGPVFEMRRDTFVTHDDPHKSVLALHSTCGPLHTRLFTEWLGEILPHIDDSAIACKRHTLHWSPLFLDVVHVTGTDTTFEEIVFDGRPDEPDSDQDWTSIGPRGGGRHRQAARHKAKRPRRSAEPTAAPPPGPTQAAPVADADLDAETSSGITYLEDPDPQDVEELGAHIAEALQSDGPSESESESESDATDAPRPRPPILPAAPVAPVLDERIFTRDWRNVRVEVDHRTTEVFEKRGEERVLLGTAKWVGLANISVHCGCHARMPSCRGRCGAIWYGDEGRQP